MPSLVAFSLAALGAGSALCTPLRPTILPRDELSLPGGPTYAQSDAVASITDMKPVTVDARTSFAYECLPMENGPLTDCNGVDYWFGNMLNKNSDKFFITLFRNRCWTLQAGVCRLYVCQNSTADMAMMSIDGHLVRGIFNDHFQQDCNKNGSNLAGHAWSDDYSVDIYSGVA